MSRARTDRARMCREPDLQDTLLERVRDGLPLEPLERAHAQECEACRIAAERLRRMRSHWVADGPSRVEMAVMAARFEERSNPRRPLWVLPAALAGLLLTALAAAQSGSLRGLLTDDEPAATEAAAPPAPKPLPAVRVRATAKAPEPAPELAPEPAPEPKPGPPPVARPRAGDGARRDPSWQRVAAAMRAGDHEAAERALERITRARDPREADTARLTLAELWLKHGQTARARRVLARLAEEGRSDLVRSRAAALYAQP